MSSRTLTEEEINALSPDGLPLQFTIPRPREFQTHYGRGIDSCRGPEGCFIQFRGVITERDKIQQAAKVLGISYGNFMRSIVNDVADRVLKDAAGRASGA